MFHQQFLGMAWEISIGISSGYNPQSDCGIEAGNWEYNGGIIGIYRQQYNSRKILENLRKSWTISQT